MSMLWAKYNQALAAQPLVVKAMTSLIGFTAGDVLAQKAVEGKEEWDVARTARMATFGALWHGPSGHYFYGFLDRMMPCTAMKTVFSKVGSVYKSNCRGASPPLLNLGIYAIDATLARRRGGAGSSLLDGAGMGASSPRNDLVNNYRCTRRTG